MNDQYVSPFSNRYASAEMSQLFSPRTRFTTWRRLWLALAKAEQQLGLDISNEQIHALESVVDLVDIERAGELEKIYRHDVMAHIHEYGEQAPSAKGIIHLGATSCYVTDNGDLILMREVFEAAAK